MFKIKVVGTYVGRSAVMDKEKIKKNYEIEGNIPTLTAALSIVKNKLLGPALSAKYPDYVAFLTYHIVEITPLTPEAQMKMDKSEVNYMSRPALLAHIKANALPVDPNYYPDLFKLREAVQSAKDDPEGYKQQFALHEADLRLDLEVAACNPELFESSSQNGLVASINVPAAPKPSSLKASSTQALKNKTNARLAGLKADQIKDGEMGEMESTEALPAEALPDDGDL